MINPLINLSLGRHLADYAGKSERLVSLETIGAV